MSGFSKKPRLTFQLGSTAVGIQTREGVVLAVEKRITSPLLEPSSVEKIMGALCYILMGNRYVPDFADFMLS